MLIAGINLGETKTGKSLKDGGVCLISDGEIIAALAEERVSKNKHSGGYQASLHYCLSKLGLSVEDVDRFVVSSCCESPRSSYSDRVAGIPSRKVRFLTHHLSHAYSTFAVSSFAKALVIIADGGGNVLKGEGSNWWEFPREQSSYYIGEGNSLKLIGRDFDKPFDAGLGEIYRYLTHHLGWRTAYAGKAMALASLGDPDRYKNLMVVRFHPETGKLFSSIKNIPLDWDTFPRFLRDNGVDTAISRSYDGDILDVHKDLARHIQDQVSEALLNKISHLSEKTGIRNLCLAGGVALNCVINQRILDETPIEKLFVQPAASDQGQSVGNAIYGSIEVGDWKVFDRFYSPYLGPEHNWDSEIKNLDKKMMSEYKIRRYENLDELIIYAAKMISDGKVVGWVQGRSESGPRALGNRSILANPYLPATKDKLNVMKKREWFMPVAPLSLRRTTIIPFSWRFTQSVYAQGFSGKTRF